MGDLSGERVIAAVAAPELANHHGGPPPVVEPTLERGARGDHGPADGGADLPGWAAAPPGGRRGGGAAPAIVFRPERRR